MFTKWDAVNSCKEVIKIKKILAVGDLHGSVSENIYEVIERYEPDFILQCGDYSCYHVSWPISCYFITGNHEVFNGYRAPIEKIISGEYKLPNNNNMLVAGLHNIQGINIVALPSKTMPGAAPGPALFTQEDYDKCWNVSIKPDIFMSHGAGFPLWAAVAGRSVQVGDSRLTDLISRLRPSFAISGHNHVYLKETQDDITLLRMGSHGTDLYDMLTIGEQALVFGSCATAQANG